MAELRVAFLGNGFSRKVMLPCLRHVEGMRAVGLASPNLARARETAALFEIEHVFADHRELLNTARPDLVFVVTPPHRHLEQTLDAMRLGCHVVCEKPTALHGGQSAEMLREHELRPGQLCLIDHELRMDPRRRQMREWIEAGRLGAPYRASYIVQSPGRSDPSAPWTWWSDASQGGGALGALGSHAVDSLRSCLGEVVAVKGMLDTFIKSRLEPESGKERAVTSDDFAGAWIRFASGALATMEVSVAEVERRHEFSVTGSKGAVQVTEQGPLRAEFPRGAGMEPVDIEDDLPPNRELDIPDTDWARSFLRLCRHIVAALGEGRISVEGAADIVDGHRNQLVLDAIRKSHESKDWVHLD